MLICFRFNLRPLQTSSKAAATARTASTCSVRTASCIRVRLWVRCVSRAVSAREQVFGAYRESYPHASTCSARTASRIRTRARVLRIPRAVSEREHVSSAYREPQPRASTCSSCFLRPFVLSWALLDPLWCFDEVFWRFGERIWCIDYIAAILNVFLHYNFIFCFMKIFNVRF